VVQVVEDNTPRAQVLLVTLQALLQSRIMEELVVK
jgi:hypothetical protein